MTDRRSSTTEFAIYLNYVRKLGFEETPDYDFLRELFTKVLKNSGEAEDGVYDWMMLNGGKGWEAGAVSSPPPSSSNLEPNFENTTVGIEFTAIDESARLRIRPASSSIRSTERSRSRKRKSGTTCPTSRRRRCRHHQHSRWTLFSLRRAREERIENGSKSLGFRDAQCEFFCDGRQGRFCWREEIVGERREWRRWRIGKSSVRERFASPNWRIR